MCVASGGVYSEGLYKFGGGRFTGFRFSSLVAGLLGLPSYDLLLSILPRGGVPPMQKLSVPWWESRAIKGSFSKPVVGRNIALHAVPVYMASTYLVSAFPAHSTSFSLNFFNLQWWYVY